MQKFGKIILPILSWGPLAWTLLALLAAKFTYVIPAFGFREILLMLAMFYVLYGGFIFWVLLISILAGKQVITKKQCLYHISITALGIVSAYLSWHYDVFGLVGTYID